MLSSVKKMPKKHYFLFLACFFKAFFLFAVDPVIPDEESYGTLWSSNPSQFAYISVDNNLVPLNKIEYVRSGQSAWEFNPKSKKEVPNVETYNLSKIHQELSERSDLFKKDNFQNQKNLLLLSLTFFLKHSDDKIFAFEYPLREVFISGHKDSQDGTLLKGGKKFGDGICNGQDRDSNTYQLIHTGTKTGQFTTNAQGEAVQRTITHKGEGQKQIQERINGSNNAAVKQAMKKNMAHSRKEAKRIINEAKKEANDVDLGKLYEILSNALEDIQKQIGTIRSCADSEQLFLFYAQNMQYQDNDDSVISFFEDKAWRARSDYVRTQYAKGKYMRSMNADLASAQKEPSSSRKFDHDDLKRTNDYCQHICDVYHTNHPSESATEESKENQAIFDRNFYETLRKYYESGELVGTTLNFHSTHEACGLCATSLGQEFKEGGLFNNLEKLLPRIFPKMSQENEEPPQEPFLQVFYSCDQTTGKNTECEADGSSDPLSFGRVPTHHMIDKSESVIGSDTISSYICQFLLETDSEGNGSTNKTSKARKERKPNGKKKNQKREPLDDEAIAGSADEEAVGTPLSDERTYLLSSNPSQNPGITPTNQNGKEKMAWIKKLKSSLIKRFQ